jgi:hypothetical protein
VNVRLLFNLAIQTGVKCVAIKPPTSWRYKAFQLEQQGFSKFHNQWPEAIEPLPHRSGAKGCIGDQGNNQAHYLPFRLISFQVINDCFWPIAVSNAASGY